MSSPPAGPPAAAGMPDAGPAPAREACPRCGASLEPAQGWCLRCGAAVRTRLVPTPAWKVPVALVVAVVVLCLVALTVAFVALTNDQGPSGGGSGTTPAPPPTTQPARP